MERWSKDGRRHHDATGYVGVVRLRTGPVSALALRYLRAVADQEWDVVSGCLSADVVRHGPFGDDVAGAAEYLSFLRRTMPALPGYRMDIDGATELDDVRAMVELRETIEQDSGPMVTHECLIFTTGADGLLVEVSIYIRQAPT